MGFLAVGALQCISDADVNILRAVSTFTRRPTIKQASVDVYHAAGTKPLIKVRDFAVLEVSSPAERKVPVQSYSSLLDQRHRKVIV